MHSEFQPLPIGHRLIRLTEATSTNTLLLQSPDYLAVHGLVVIADHQTNGRGRSGRTFVSFPGQHLTFSLVIHPRLPLEQAGLYSLLAGVAVQRALAFWISPAPRLKWPNDVRVQGKKISGILLEMGRLPASSVFPLVIGIGLNTQGSVSDYPSELRPWITTLASEVTPAPSNEEVFQALLTELEWAWRRAEASGSTGIIEEWLAVTDSLGRTVRYEKATGWAEGTIESLNAQGHLLIREATSGELDTHLSGEVIYV